MSNISYLNALNEDTRSVKWLMSRCCPYFF